MFVRHSLPAIAVCAALLSGCNLGCLFAPCDAALNVVVVAKDPAGTAIGGVQLDVLGRSGETDRDGCASIHGVVQPTSIFRDAVVTLRAERTGYKALRDVRPLAAYRIELTLQPADSSKPSSAVWTPASAGASLACN